MSDPSRGRVGVVEVAVAAVLLLAVAAFIVPLLGRARSRPLSTCPSNLRQFGIGMIHYAIQNDGMMPPANANICAYARPYIAPLMGERLFAAECPSDRLSDFRSDGFSYAFNCTTFLSPGQVEANRDYSPFSTLEWARGDAVIPGKGRYLAESPADTIMMAEYWGPDRYHDDPGDSYDRLMVDVPDKLPKHALRAPPGQDNPWTAAGASYHPPKQDTVALPADNVHEWLGNFDGRSFDRAFHRGRSNVLYVDGHVEALEARKLGAMPPSGNPQWTALLD